MVQHIVMWNFRPELDADEVVKELQKVFAKVAPQVPGLQSLRVHRGYQGYHGCLMSVHDSREALAAYQTHPAHLEARKVVHGYLTERASCDFEL